MQRHLQNSETSPQTRVSLHGMVMMISRQVILSTLRMQRATGLLQRMVTTRPKTTRPLWLLMARSLKSKIRRQRLNRYQRKWARLPPTRVIFSMTERKTSRRVIPSSWKRMVRMSLQRMVTTPQRMERSSRLWMARLSPSLMILQR